MTEKFLLISKEIKHENGHCFIVKLPDDIKEGDSSENPYKSRLVLWENEFNMGPAHSVHADIRNTGNGTYSHWENYLMFSASDNSDPRYNNRTYRCELTNDQAILSNDLNLYLNCLPKSGSDYLVNLFCKVMKLRYLERAGGTFPESYLFHDFFSTAGSGWVYRGHEQYNRYHKYQISRYLDRMVVHLRDPRAAVLSFTHYADALAKNSPSLAKYHHINEDFLSRPLSYKLDLMIEYLTPLMVEWISSWIEAENDQEFGTKILFTTFEKFKESEEKFVSEILKYFDIQNASFYHALDKSGAVSKNFRKGQIDEWRNVLSIEQINKINEYVPDRIVERFSWVR